MKLCFVIKKNEMFFLWKTEATGDYMKQNKTDSERHSTFPLIFEC